MQMFDDDDDYNNNNNSLKIYKEIGVKLDNKSGMTMYQNQSKRVMKLRLPHNGTNSAN